MLPTPTINTLEVKAAPGRRHRTVAAQGGGRSDVFDYSLACVISAFHRGAHGANPLHEGSVISQTP